MKLWKSPVLYLGIALVVAVLAALLAPLVVDWNGYRAEFESYGRKLTGRAVTIDGAISARLFPWPSLTAEDVHIANPPGMTQPDFARADRITFRIQLAGLLNGTVEVDSIEIDRPVVALERLTTGVGNWRLQPSADLGSSKFLNRIRLDAIELEDATLRLIDGRRGPQSLDIKLPAVTVASPGVAGPWRASAMGTSFAGREFDVNLSTGVLKAGAPVRFALTIAGAGGTGPVVGFDGSLADGRIAGNVLVRTIASSEAKGDAEGQLRPLAIRAKVAGSFDEVAFDKIEIAPFDPGQAGTLVGGGARVKLGARIVAAVDLTAPRLELAEWAGATVHRALREGGSLAVADSLLANLPEAAELSGALSVTALQAGAESLENVVLQIDASRDAIRVRKLLATLPGRSRILFDGVFFPGRTGAELAGNLAVESNDLRKFAAWAWPSAKGRIAELWTGSRGRLKLETEVNVTPAQLRFARSRFELDGVPGEGELAISSGGRGEVELRIDAQRLDIDNFVAGGIAALPSGERAGLAGLLGVLAPQAEAGDLRLVVNSKELVLNGVTAERVNFDIEAGARGLRLRTLAIAAVGGARLSASGLILDSGSGPDGAITLEIAADDPRGLVRLVGLGDPAWAKALGATALAGSLDVKSREGVPAARLSIKGRSGDFDISAEAGASGSTDLGAVAVEGAAELKAATGAAIAGLFGLAPGAGEQSSGRVKVAGKGSLAAGFAVDLLVQAYGAQLTYEGRLGGIGGALSPDGRLSLRSTDAGPLLSALGIPLAMRPAGVLVIDATVRADGDGVAFSAIDGNLAGSAIAGALNWRPGGQVTGTLATGPLRLADVLAATFLAWNGAAPGLDQAFAAALPLGLTGEIWIAPEDLRVNDTFSAGDAEIGISAAPGEIRLAMFGKAADGRDAHLEIASRGEDGNRELDGRLTLPFDLARELRLAEGRPVAEGDGVIDLRFSGRGRSPAGAIAAMQGSGTYDIRELKLLDIAPADFLSAVAGAKDAAALAAAFAKLRGGEGLTAGDVSGTINVVDGVAAFLPVTLASPAADAVVKAVAEPAGGEIDISVALSFKAAMPGMEIAYAGPPAALARSEDRSELAGRLGYGIMQRGVAELERLQQEQERLAVEEERRRLEDEEKLRAYYAQRDEILNRRRELKVHRELRVRAAEELRLEIESERAANLEINRGELRQRGRELKVHRRLQRLAQRGSVETPPPPKAKPKIVKPRPLTEAPIPLVIFPPPAAPSQQ